jgi:hypothetical protein
MLNKFPLIVVDESTNARISEAFRKADFNIFCIQEMMPGTDDTDIILLQQKKERIF